MVRTISNAVARRIALAAQGFDRPRPNKVDRRHLRRVMRTLGVLQLDTIPVIARPQHLVPFSRLGPYDEGLLNRVAYSDDEWFESWAHEASLVPMETEPLLRWRQVEMKRDGHWSGAGLDPDYVEQVWTELEGRGPLTAGELIDSGSRKNTDHAWGGQSQGRLALGRLLAIGRAGSRRIGNFERQYDVIERVVPSSILQAPTPGTEDAQRQLLIMAARSLGVATLDDLADYYRIPVPVARPLVADLVDAAQLTPIQVDGWEKPAFRFAGSKAPRSVTASALLSPFDPLIWHRPRAERLFGFHYRIEIYVPKAKRKYGYYVLPYLLGDQLVARVDVKAERAEHVLSVKGAWIEPGFDPDVVAPPLQAELRSLAKFQQLDQVRVEPNGDLAAHLPALENSLC